MQADTKNKLLILLSLQHELRKLQNPKQFAFFASNETHQLFPYKLGVCWRVNNLQQVEILSQSGSAEVDKHAPLTQNLIEIITTTIKQQQDKPSEVCYLKSKLIIGTKSYSHVLWCPFVNADNKVVAGLCFYNDAATEQQLINQYQWLHAAYQYSWNLMAQQKRLFDWHKQFTPHRKKILTVAAVAALIISIFPTHLSVRTAAKLIAKDPANITAPMQGVLEEIYVKPNQYVKQGTLLAALDKTELQSKLDIAKEQLAVTQASLHKAIQKGFNDKSSRAEVNILQAQQEQQKLEVNYRQKLLSESALTAPRAGFAIFDKPNEWRGKPVSTGETIMQIVANKQRELELWMPVSGAFDIEQGDHIRFYPQGSVIGSIDGQVLRQSFDAELTPEGILAYRITAKIAVDQSDKLPRLGLQGTAKIYGQRVPFIYYLLRRPLAFLRQYMPW